MSIENFPTFTPEEKKDENQEETPESELEVENEEKGEVSEGQDNSKNESWLKKHSHKLRMGLAGLAVLSTSVDGKALNKTTAEEEVSKKDKDKKEEFSKQDKDKKELFMELDSQQFINDSTESVSGVETETSEERFSVWKGARIGDYGSDDHADLVKNLIESNVKLHLNFDALRTIALNEKPQFLQFTRVTGKQLGLTKGAKYKDLREVMRRNHLGVVPEEGTPQLLIQNDISDTTVEKSPTIKVVMPPHEYEEKLTRRTRGIDRTIGREDLLEREGTGKEFKVVFIIVPGDKNLPTGLYEEKAPSENDLIDLDQEYLVTVQPKKKKD